MCLSYQNHRGRSTSTEVWVFGLADTSQSPALGYMEVVHQRDVATLLPIILAHVAPGTEVHSDQWAAYNQVCSLSNVSTYNTVKHSVIFLTLLLGHLPQTLSPIGITAKQIVTVTIHYYTNLESKGRRRRGDTRRKGRG